MSYEEQLKKVLDEYNILNTKYQELTASDTYHKILSTMPFEFLDASQLYGKLELFSRLDVKPKMKFDTLDEAIVFYQSLLNCKANIKPLLEQASYIAEVGALASQINDLAMSSPYLGPNYIVIPNEEVIGIAEKCLSQLPNYPNVMTKTFRWNYIESVIRCLDIEDLAKMCEQKIIKAGDLDHISLIETENQYKEKLLFLCDLLQHPHPVIQSYELKLKGVTFPNEDGSSRQENLNLLRIYAEQNPTEEIVLTAENYTYTPEIGNPEPAIKIAWNGKVIGNVARDVATEIVERFKNPQFTSTLKSVTGGGEVTSGCIIHLNVLATELEMPQTEQVER